MGLFSLFKPTKSVVVIDGLSLYDSAGLGGKVAPRNQLQVLRRLSRFSQQEKVELVAVLCGSPLHKAPHGKKFEDIQVVYSKSEDAHAKFLLKTVRSQGASGVLIVGNTPAEKEAVDAGLKTMRMSTFRKAFDVGGGFSEGGEGGNREGGNRGNRSRPPRRRQASKKTQPQQQQDAPPKKERAPKAVTEADAINELIDLVD